jgi:hypothetical protein
VRILNQRFEQIATHIRHGPGGFSTLDAHLHSAKISHVERGAQELVDRARELVRPSASGPKPCTNSVASPVFDRSWVCSA